MLRRCSLTQSSALLCPRHFIASRHVIVSCLQVHFPTIICLTGVKIGAAPGTGSLTDVPHVHVFAHDLHTLSGSRYACVAQHCNLPDSGTRAVRVEVSIKSEILSHTATWPVTEHLLCAADLHQAVVTARSVSDTAASGLWMGAASWFRPQGKPTAAHEPLQHCLAVMTRF